MPVIKSLEDLRRVREEALRRRQAQLAGGPTQIVVGIGTPSIAAGVLDTLQAILDLSVQGSPGSILVRQTGSFGLDSWEPIVQVITPAGPGAGEGAKVTYGRVTPQAARLIMQEHVIGGRVVAEFVIPGT